jgi:hypothetical protein
MAINNSFAHFLFYQRTKGVNFERTITLGRMRLYADKEQLKSYIKKYGASVPFEKATFTEGYAEPFFEILGAKKLDSIDYSDYENASMIQDLNKPVPESLHGKYSVVLDSGTLEHVFNFPVAIKSCMEMTSVDGHYIAVTPANNMFGHGFYQFSPELYYRVFSKENGFEVTQMTIGVFNEDGNVEKWYDVKDPVEVRSRVLLLNNKETFLFVVAKKIEATEIFKTTPYQSDYVATWESKVEADNGAETVSLKSTYRKYAPKGVKSIIQKFRAKMNKSTFQDEFIGTINPAHFKEIKF